MQAIKISATTRTSFGKNENRRRRADGQIPAVTYGKGKPNQSLSVSPLEVKAALFSEYGRNTVIDLEIDGKSVGHAMIGDYQYHPVTRELLHADLVQVNDDSLVSVKVPVIVTGKSKGVVLGGKLRQVFRELPLRCKPADIPVNITIDVTELDLEQHIRVGDLKLAAGVTVEYPARQSVVAVALDRRAKTGEGDEEGGAAGAAAPAAAPAAAAKAAKK